MRRTGGRGGGRGRGVGVVTALASSNGRLSEKVEEETWLKDLSHPLPRDRKTKKKEGSSAVSATYRWSVDGR